MTTAKPLTAEELAAIFSRPLPTFANDFLRLKRHIDALRERIFDLECQAETLVDAELEARTVVPDGWKLVPIKWTPAMEEQIAHNLCDGYGPDFVMANREFARDVWSKAYTAAPRPPGQEDHSHAARLNRLLGILRRLKWQQIDGATFLSPVGPADALNELGLFMLSHELDQAIAGEHRPPMQAVSVWVKPPPKEVEVLGDAFLSAIKGSEVLPILADALAELALTQRPAIDARPEVTVRAEALRAEADRWHGNGNWSGDGVAYQLRAEADRLDPPKKGAA